MSSSTPPPSIVSRQHGPEDVLDGGSPPVELAPTPLSDASDGERKVDESSGNYGERRRAGRKTGKGGRKGRSGRSSSAARSSGRPTHTTLSLSPSAGSQDGDRDSSPGTSLRQEHLQEPSSPPASFPPSPIRRDTASLSMHANPLSAESEPKPSLPPLPPDGTSGSSVVRSADVNSHSMAMNDLDLAGGETGHTATSTSTGNLSSTPPSVSPTAKPPSNAKAVAPPPLPSSLSAGAGAGIAGAPGAGASGSVTHAGSNLPSPPKQNRRDPSSSRPRGPYQPLSHGTMNFTSMSCGSHRGRFWARIRKTDSAPSVFNWMRKAWDLSAPEVMFSITGGADLDLPPRQQIIFKRGFSTAANTVASWVISGGTDTGVMKLVGSALGESGMHGSVPVVGICTFHKIIGNELFHESGEVMYSARAFANDAAALNPDHTHFLLVDDNDGSPSWKPRWGREVDFRLDFETEVGNSEPHSKSSYPRSRKHRCNSVQLVLSGGMITLDTVKSAVVQQVPIIVFRNTGRAADVIAKLEVARRKYQSTKKSYEESKAIPASAIVASTPLRSGRSRLSSSEPESRGLGGPLLWNPDMGTKMTELDYRTAVDAFANNHVRKIILRQYDLLSHKRRSGSRFSVPSPPSGVSFSEFETPRPSSTTSAEPSSPATVSDGSEFVNADCRHTLPDQQLAGHVADLLDVPPDDETREAFYTIWADATMNRSGPLVNKIKSVISMWRTANLVVAKGAVTIADLDDFDRSDAAALDRVLTSASDSAPSSGDTAALALGRSLESTIVRAVLRGAGEEERTELATFEARLRLAVRWDCKEVVREQLHRAVQGPRSGLVLSGASGSKVFEGALGYASKLDRASMARILVDEAGASVTALDDLTLRFLFSQRRIARGDKLLRTNGLIAASPLGSSASIAHASAAGAFVTATKSLKSPSLLLPFLVKDLREAKIVAPTFLGEHGWNHPSLEQWGRNAIAVLRVVVALLGRNYKMARLLWEHTNTPLRTVLLCAYLLRSSNVKSQREETAREAEYYESVAVGLVRSLDGLSTASDSAGLLNQDVRRWLKAEMELNHAARWLNQAAGPEYWLVDVVLRYYIRRNPNQRITGSLTRLWHPRGKSIVQLAVRGYCKRFVGEALVQAALFNVWSTGRWTVDIKSAAPPPPLARDDSERAHRKVHYSGIDMWKRVATKKRNIRALRGQVSDGSDGDDDDGDEKRNADGSGNADGNRETKSQEEEIKAAATPGPLSVIPESETADEDDVSPWYIPRITPRLKHRVYTLAFTVYIVLYAAVILRKPEFSIFSWEWLLYVWTFSAFLADLERQSGGTSRNFWDYFLLTTHSVVGTAFALRVIAWISDSGACLSLSWDVLAVGIVFACLRFLDVFSVDATLGPLAIILGDILFQDILAFIVIFVVFSAGFILAFTSMFVERIDSSSISDVYDLLWATFGDFTLPVEIEAGNREWWLAAFTALYLTAVSIVLVNLLIAMMADTYSRIRDNSDIEWKFAMVRTIYQYKQCSLLPPPFNYFTLAVRLVRRLSTAACRARVNRWRRAEGGGRAAAMCRRIVDGLAGIGTDDSHDDFNATGGMERFQVMGAAHGGTIGSSRTVAASSGSAGTVAGVDDGRSKPRGLEHQRWLLHQSENQVRALAKSRYLLEARGT